MINKIFLDLDDVCNYLTLYLLWYVGCPIDLSLGYKHYNFNYDIVGAANALHPFRKFTATGFWNSFNKEVWASVPESAEFDLLLQYCEALVGRENICVLTGLVSSYMNCPGCLDGKIDWLQKHFPKGQHFLIGLSKHFCAQPDALLIDDNEDNINKFRKHGGQTILVPRPWNSLHGVNSREYLAHCLGEKE